MGGKSTLVSSGQAINTPHDGLLDLLGQTGQNFLVTGHFQ